MVCESRFYAYLQVGNLVVSALLKFPVNTKLQARNRKATSTKHEIGTVWTNFYGVSGGSQHMPRSSCLLAAIAFASRARLHILVNPVNSEIHQLVDGQVLHAAGSQFGDVLGGHVVNAHGNQLIGFRV